MKALLLTSLCRILLMSSIFAISCTGSKSDPEGSVVDVSTSGQVVPTKEETVTEPVVEQPVPPVEDPVSEPVVPAAPYKFSEGNGTLKSPYAIKTVKDLLHIKEKLGAQFSLLNDLDLTGVTLEPIGSMTTPFSGVFYGRNKRIDNLKMAATDGSTIALFGVVTGTISQLIISVDITSNGYAAGLVGTLLENGFISGCKVYGKVTSALGGNGYQTGIGNSMLVSASQSASVYGATVGAIFNGQSNQHYLHFGPVSTTSQTCSGGTCVPAEFVCNTNNVIRVSQCCHVYGRTNKCY